MLFRSRGYEEVAPWAKKTRQTILQRSPTSVRVSLRQLREGKKWSIAETFQKEHAIASRFMEHPDFVEGVTALLVDKPKRTPNWSPDTIDKVSEEDVDTFFTHKTDFQLLGTEAGSMGQDYNQYPHAWIGLPHEGEVFVPVKEGKSREEIVKLFEQRTNGKLGVKEKVEEVLNRKAKEVDGKLQWQR